jgi:Zn-dependent metalloprotease
MHRRFVITLVSLALLVGAAAITGAPPVQAGPAAASSQVPAGSFALSGQAARDYQVPPDAVEIRSWHAAQGRTATRYQQVVDGATVFGAQITIMRDAGGSAVSVVGAYFPGLRAKGSASIGKARARDLAEREIGPGGRWRTTLRLDPTTATLFYEVQSLRDDTRPVRWIDARSGAVRKAFDALAEGDGIGVKGDVKAVDSRPAAGGGFELVSPDDRRATYDAGNKQTRGTLMTDADDHWDFVHAAWRSPDQRPGVDAHYYADVVDDFYGATFGRDSIDDDGMQIISTVHFANRYCNAFWNGIQMTYGDGDGRTCIPLSGGLDVVGHELTHGVTEFTSNLIYENEPGALNEAFSDMMGNTIEFYADGLGRDPAGTPDWLIGEDVILSPDVFPGFRNMADPAEDNDPDHYSLLLVGAADNGFVHSNSGIANHAYYLALAGGQNAGCIAQNGHLATHTADCDITVNGVGVDRAAQIFYDGFTSLPEYANFCDARNGTVAVAGGDRSDISDAWAAVGVHADCTPGVAPPPPCVGDDNATIPFESPHPYGNNGDCTWTYDNGTGGFAFHFSLLDTEKDFDYVHVKDGNGAVLATYTGLSRRPVTSPCIPTSTGSVQLTSDASVVAQGFIVDAVVPC